MSAELPPPGPRLPFREWARRVVHTVRRRLPKPVMVKADPDGAVTLRLGSRVARIAEHDAVRTITFAEDGKRPGSTMTGLTDGDRGDAFTADNLGASIASYLT